MIQDPKQTKMVKPDRKVKVKILRDCLKPGSDEILRPETIVELDESQARELLKYKGKGMYEFAGERESVMPLGVIRKAALYKEDQPKDELEIL